MKRAINFFTLLLSMIIIDYTGAETASPKKLEPTPSLTEGPFYKAGSPEKSILYTNDDSGQIITIRGRVVDKNGNALSGAWIDFWQADPGGSYDNSGYKFRGHIFTDSNGNYRLETMLPGDYTGRTPHIHVKIKHGKGEVLTTQIFFPKWSNKNYRDNIFNQKLVVKMADNDKTAVFDFVLDQ